MNSIVRRGDRGPDIRTLQQTLKDLGFSPGNIDGVFGPATVAAVVAFQRASDLLADGVVGPRCWEKLGFPERGIVFDVSDQIDVSLVAEMFPNTWIDSIEQNLPHVVEAMMTLGLVDKPMMLMALSTIRAETERFEPISEEPSRYNSSPGGRPFDLYDHRRDLGNEGAPDGQLYRGRGFVQLTGRANYIALDKSLGLDGALLREPEIANEPAIAAKIMAIFLRHRERAIKIALLTPDLARARRLVNGGMHGFSRFSHAFQIGDRLIHDATWSASILRENA